MSSGTDSLGAYQCRNIHFHAYIDNVLAEEPLAHINLVYVSAKGFAWICSIKPLSYDDLKWDYSPELRHFFPQSDLVPELKFFDRGGNSGRTNGIFLSRNMIVNP